MEKNKATSEETDKLINKIEEHTEKQQTSDITKGLSEMDSKCSTFVSSENNKDPNIGEDDEKPERREHTRSKLALLFVLGFFAIQFLCIAYAIKVNATIAELKDMLIAVIGALSGTLGFIVGFYYKSIKEQ